MDKIVMEARPDPPERAQSNDLSEPWAVKDGINIRVTIRAVEPRNWKGLHLVAAGGHALRIGDIVTLLRGDL